jgi:predicted TIM-barrel enzyme
MGYMQISPADHSGMPESQEAEFARKAHRLRALSEDLAVKDPDAAAACESGADVLESLAEPVMRWND